MAKRIRVDRGYEGRLDEFEQTIFLLKINYDKYFNGFEKIEPSAERDRARRELMELEQDCPNNTAQRHKLISLKSRYSSYELYWQRNLVQIERGTHPKFKFRAAVKDREREALEAASRRNQAEQQAEQHAQDRARKEDRAYQAVFDKYLEARKQCGQGTDLSFDAVRQALKGQVESIKAKTGCRSVKFRIAVEAGKAKVKAVPVT